MKPILACAFLSLLCGCGPCKCMHIAKDGDAYQDSRDCPRPRIVRHFPLDRDQKKVLPHSYVNDCVVRPLSKEDGERPDNTDRDMGSPNNSGSRVA